MAMRGVHFAISDATLAYMRELDSPTATVELISNVLEEGWASQSTCYTDKAWGLIHTTLQGSNPCSDSLERASDDPSSWVILGRVDLPSPDDYLIGFIGSDDVPRVAEVMAGLSDEEFASRLSGLANQFGCSDVRSHDVEFATSNFAGLRDFFQHAAERGRHVIFTVDF